MAVETFQFDPADSLDSRETVREFIAAALESGDAEYIAHAMGIVMRSQGMARIARETGRSREQLYRTFSENGNPTLANLLSAIQVLGLELTAVDAEPDPATEA